MTDWSVLLEEERKQEKAAAREAKEQRLPEDVVAMLEDPSRPRATNSQTFYRLAEFIMGRSELTAEGHRIADEEGALGRVIESEAVPVPDACLQYKHSVRIFAEHTPGGFWRGGKNRSHHDYDADADRWIAHQPQAVREACQALGPLTRRDCELRQRRGAVWQLLYDWLDGERGVDQRAAVREAEVSRRQELAAALPAPGAGDGAVWQAASRAWGFGERKTRKTLRQLVAEGLASAEERPGRGSATKVYSRTDAAAEGGEEVAE
ncbi:MAG: hypothetical protein M3R49_08595 [Chloroflexota bacterium]|nr:hypothetical protein [Chloroflexota bacterium]